MENPKRAQKRKLDTAKARGTYSRRSQCFGGQGVRREAESEGHAEKYRAVVDGSNPDDEPLSRPKVGQGRARSMGAKAISFTHRTKVFADGTVRKIST